MEAPACDEAVVRRRAVPEALTLDLTGCVISASAGASALLGCALTAGESAPTWLANHVRHLARRPMLDDASLVRDGLLLRFVPMFAGAAGTIVLVEQLQSRDPVSRAIRQYGLTRREADVLRELLRGASTLAIAATLYIAETTVADHVKHIAIKLNAKGRGGIVASVIAA